jgi:transcription factor C subunit 7
LEQHSPHIDSRYKVTWLPSRRGENVAEIHGRVGSFLRAFFTRLDLAALGAPVASDAELDLGRHKNILFIGHAASVIVMARELVGDRHLAMRAGCCSLSTLVPKLDVKRSSYLLTPSISASSNRARTLSNAGVGQWDLIVNAAADFLPNGAERDWGFEDIEVAAGEVVNDIGERGTENMSEGPTERGLQIELPPELFPAGPDVVNSPSRTLRL